MNPTQASVEEREAVDGLMTERLAELVHALTGCGPVGAWFAVRRSQAARPDCTDRLDVLARAIVNVRRGIDLRDDPVPE